VAATNTTMAVLATTHVSNAVRHTTAAPDQDAATVMSTATEGSASKPGKGRDNGAFRQRFLIVACIICGSLAAGLLYKSTILPRAPLTDDEARRFGYASAEDKKETSAAFSKYWPDIVANGRLTDSEYQLAKETFDHGSFAAKTRIIVAFGYLRGDTERKRALDMMPKDSIASNLLGAWRSSMRRWMNDSKGDEVLAMLTASGNANAAKIADELRSARNAQQ
jgi:hypothetical protein